MRIAIGAIHAGFELKKDVASYLDEMGHQVVDVWTNSADPASSPDYAANVGEALLTGKANHGILICGSGVRASMAANKIAGIRAGLCHDTYSARQGVEHDDMSVLVLGAGVTGFELARDLVRLFLEASFTGEERHRRRLEKVRSLENSHKDK